MGRTRTKVACAAIAALVSLPLVPVAAAATASPADQSTAVSPGPSDWTTDRYNAQRINANLAETTLSPSTVGQLHLAWKTPSPQDVPNGPTTDAYTSYNPIVVGDYVYAPCGDDLCAYDRKTGTTKWRATGAAGQSLIPVGPTYGGGLLFINAASSLQALDPSTGKEVWSTSFASNTAPADLVLNSPVYDNGMVFVNMGSGAIHAVDAKSGDLVWTYQLEGQTELSAYDGVLYAEFGAHDEQTGDNVVGVLGSGWPGPGVISDDRVFTATGLAQTAVAGKNDPYLPLHHTPGDGAPFWTQQGSPAVADGTAYYSGEFGTGIAQGPPQINALKITDPYYGGFNHAWQTVLPGSTNYATTPTVANGVVYSATSSGQLYAANAKTGALLWMYSTNSPWKNPSALPSPVVANGMVFVQTGNQLFAFTTDPGDSTGVPAQPTQLVTNDGDGQVLLGWTEPSTAGAAMSYRVTVQPSGQVVTTGGTAVTIKGLNDWTRYTFAITPLNAVGAGPTLVSPTITPRPAVTIATVKHDGHVALYGAGKWRSLGGQATSAPAVVTVDGDPYVFVRGPDQRIWVRGTDVAWQLFGPRGRCASGPAATATDGGTIEVACRAADNHLLTARSPVPDVGGLPHAAAWTYNALTLRGRPALGKWDDAADGYDTVIAARPTTSDKLEFLPSTAFGGSNGPAACGASPVLADTAAGAARGWACKSPKYDDRQPQYLNVETYTTAVPGPTPPYPFGAGQLGMAVIASGPVVVGLAKTGEVIAQIQPPSPWGVTPWPGPTTPAKPINVIIGKNAKYGVAAATTVEPAN